MPEKPDTAVTLTHRAIGLRTKDPEAARELLGVAPATDAEHEPAWRWLVEFVTDDAERLFNPDEAHVIKADLATDRPGTHCTEDRKRVRDGPRR